MIFIMFVFIIGSWLPAKYTKILWLCFVFTLLVILICSSDTRQTQAGSRHLRVDLEVDCVSNLNTGQGPTDSSTNHAKLDNSLSSFHIFIKMSCSTTEPRKAGKAHSQINSDISVRKAMPPISCLCVTAKLATPSETSEGENLSALYNE